MSTARFAVLHIRFETDDAFTLIAGHHRGKNATEQTVICPPTCKSSCPRIQIQTQILIASPPEARHSPQAALDSLLGWRRDRVRATFPSLGYRLHAPAHSCQCCPFSATFCPATDTTRLRITRFPPSRTTIFTTLPIHSAEFSSSRPTTIRRLSPTKTRTSSSELSHPFASPLLTGRHC